jgi:predicted RNA-binding Zn-ribbon protein involved in translation (DUF1610 family)
MRTLTFLDTIDNQILCELNIRKKELKMHKKCPNCGFREIRQCSLEVQAYLRLSSTNNLFNQFPSVIADVCTECGNILSMKAEHPKYFKIDK